MSSEEPIYLQAEGHYITDADRQQAMMMVMFTGRPIVVNVAPKPPWWQFWKRKKQK
ncbi:MAG: hypothetical protein HLX50_00410 [Alteromonadaceae bacterium]|nr:hypothetical protein [Alteromonadaceae bacterium]